MPMKPPGNSSLITNISRKYVTTITKRFILFLVCLSADWENYVFENLPEIRRRIIKSINIVKNLLDFWYTFLGYFQILGFYITHQYNTVIFRGS